MLCLLLLGAQAVPSWAEDCSDYPNGVLDGFAGTPAPSQLNIDRNCTIRNYTAANPFDTNISFFTSPGQNNQRWIVIFDNVVHTGQMACNSIAGHKIWFTNGSSTAIQEGCQNYLIPVEKIDKRNPTGQTTASIGVPFTYTLTLPVLYDPGTGVVIDTAGSLNTLHSIVLTDDLNATGADLTYLGHQVYLAGSGTPVSHSFSNVGGLLTFANFFDSQSIITAGDQVIIEVTVVLDDTPANTPGTQFVNTAKWDFGRLIDGEFFEPLPGEWGITEPLTIAAPDLEMTKTGPALVNLGQSADFTLDIRNAGNSDAWDAVIVDRLPDGGTGGMCDTTPTVLSAQVYEADGVTPAAGKGALIEGTDYTFDYSAAPTCRLTLTMLSAAAVIGPGQRLIIGYRSKLDANSQDGVSLTNVAGITEWSNDDSSNNERQTYTRNLSNGSVGTTDHQDAHTLTVALSGVFFEKTVANLDSGDNPATVAAPGDRLRYTLRLQTTDSGVSNLRFYDDLGELNSTAVFEPGSLTLVSVPPGLNFFNTNPNGGTNGAGILDIRNISLPPFSQLSVQFDVTLASALLDGTVVSNQADLMSNVKLADSDDPTVNGQSDPDIAGDEDPTQVVIEAVPPPALAKASTQATAAIGEQFSYRITVPSAPHSAPIYDVRILDNLLASGADLSFVSAQKISGPGSWTPVNTGSNTSLVIEGSGGGIDIPAGQQVVIEITVVMQDSANNTSGLSFTNSASYTYNQLDNMPSSQLVGGAGNAAPMTVVEPELTLEKSGPPIMRVGQAGTFTFDVQNTGNAPAYRLTITDLLPDSATGGMCDVAPSQITAQLFESDGVTPVSAPLNAGSDFAVSFSGAPTCSFTITTLTAAAAIGAGQRLIVSYQTYLDADTQRDEVLTNVAAATQWYSADDANVETRVYNRTLTNGTVGVLDHEDAHTTVEFSPLLRFEKTAVNLTSGQNPAIDAEPGDRLRYTLVLENVGAFDIDDFDLVDELDRLNSVPAFQAGSLTLVAVPAGADTAGTSAVGGASGTGRLQIGNLSLAVGEMVQVVFEAQLAPVIANDSYVFNQSQMMVGGFVVADSDDPNINGPADPTLIGDEDPTRVQIDSAVQLDIDKISTDLSGDPNVLLAGETLRYTITVQNIGNDNAFDAVLRDQIPANTTYVAGSTTLNGNPLADAGGTSPLVGGISLYSPRNATPGYLPADASGATDNKATLQFDVVINPDLLDGTVVANQAFVNAVNAGIGNQPSDDPRTAVVDDPTRNVVGNVPLLYAEKSALLYTDGGTPGLIDPGDTLRYTIVVHNNGAIPATNVMLNDGVPGNTTYVANSTTLNGLPVAQPDGGVFPLQGGIAISSADLTPPLPAAGEGTLTAGEFATVQFDLVVNAGTPTGTLITNQARVRSDEVSSLLTDGDGDPATGPEPTVVVVGDAQQLAISKQVAVVGGGPAVAGATLEYVIQVSNIGSVPAYGIVITDNLDDPVAGQLAFVAGSASLNGTATGLNIAGAVLSADYDAAYGALPPGELITIRFQAVIDDQLPIGTAVTNRADVTWNTSQTAQASVTIDVGGTPGTGALNGTVWHDANFNNVLDANERLLAGWTVELYRNDQLALTTTTDADGVYAFSAIIPNYLSEDTYRLAFVAPGAGPNTALLGEAYSADFSNGLQAIDDIEVRAGNNLLNLDLPIDPNGVVYDSVSRAPVPGATLTLLNDAGAALPAGCFDDPQQQDQVTGPDGYYKFDLNFSSPACPSAATYTIQIVAPGSGFMAGYSGIIPPATNPAAPFDVPACPGTANDAVAATGEFCEVQAAELAPGTAVAAQSAGTVYHVYLVFNNSGAPGSSQVFNNHIPLDPILEGAISIAKTTPMVNVNRGQLVPYNITVRNSYGIDLQNVNVVDRYPAGFHYIEGSARIDGEAMEPVSGDGELVWSNLTLAAEGEHTIRMLLGVGAGVSEGEFINRAQAVNSLNGGAMSGVATATVRLVPDPTFDCTDVIGKVYDDHNRNGLQDNDEPGIPSARVVTARGLAATTDAYGRFHFTCPIVPREGRGSNFVLKLDDRTLPSGYRASTDLLQVRRATRGKTLRFNFGASIHRVVGLDIADAVFEPGTADIRPQWLPRFALLLEELQKGPAVLRLSYLADLEEPDLVDRRLQVVKQRIANQWNALNCCYRLVIEPEVFWRLGAPAEKAIKRVNKQEAKRR